MISTIKLIQSVLLIVVLYACNNTQPKSTLRVRNGEYEMNFDVGAVQIPIRLGIEDKHWYIHNWTEVIALDSLQITDSVFHIDMPLFNTSLSGKFDSDSTFTGVWIDHSRDSLYQIPFVAFLKYENHQPAISSPETTQELTYQVTFSPEIPSDKSDAIGKFMIEQNKAVGTFLTESGDYRFLEGDYTGNSIHLSSFDGAHLFYFCANVNDNTLTDGKFYSGKHWSEEWIAMRNDAARLRNPDSLTFIRDEIKPFSFRVQNFNGDTVAFDSSAFAGHVSIVQIFGSWCPNCTDESVFLKGLYDQYHQDGLNIIPVAFERNADLNVAHDAIEKQFSQLGLIYTPYFGGCSNKSKASEVFPMLNNVSSFPTMIIVDKTGAVRKIHTGFYGPGTGEHYKNHCTELTDFVNSLLREKGPLASVMKK